MVCWGVGVSHIFRIFLRQKWQKRIPSNPLPNFAPQSEKLLNNQHLWQLLLCKKESNV
jgi:hypothetical protein